MPIKVQIGQDMVKSKYRMAATIDRPKEAQLNIDSNFYV
jgi:hypothetical protein